MADWASLSEAITTKQKPLLRPVSRSEMTWALVTAVNVSLPVWVPIEASVYSRLPVVWTAIAALRAAVATGVSEFPQCIHCLTPHQDGRRLIGPAAAHEPGMGGVQRLGG